jgi:hypothetical protein
MELFRISRPGSLPGSEEIDHYRNGQFQAIELTADDIPWERYSDEFAKQESVERASRSISAIQTTSPRPKPSPRHAAEEEEEKQHAEARDASSRLEAEDDYEGPEQSEDDNPFPFTSTSLGPDKEAGCIAVATRWARSREAMEMAGLRVECRFLGYRRGQP